MKPTVRRLIALALGGLVFTSVALAQPSTGRRRHRARVVQTKRATKRPLATKAKAKAKAPTEAEMAATEAEELGEGANKVKVFRFTGVDISGRLKSPQLLYFLSRLRTEFYRPKLPHRSFIPELKRSAKGKAF